MKTILAFILLASIAHAFSVEVTWTDNSTSETGFVVQRSLTGNAEDWADIGRALPNATGYVDTVAPEGQKLWYRIYAINDATHMQSDFSAPAIYTPHPPPTPTPIPKPAVLKKPTNAKVKAK